MIQVFKPLIVPEAIQAVQDVLQSGWIGLGPKTKQFEEDFAQYIGVPHAVAVNSGTSALHLAIILSDVGDGDEVITTANTFVSTNHAILYQKGIPVFCDVEKETGNIDANLVEGLITERTKAIITVHYAGYPCDMLKLVEVCKKHNLKLIEDCAHACGSKISVESRSPNETNSMDWQRVGTFGDFACFSFHAVKNLPMGDGGMLITKYIEDYEKAKKLRWLGIDRDTFKRASSTNSIPGKYLWKYDVPYVGFKYHMNDINAAIGIEQLKYLDDHNLKRCQIAKIYEGELGSISGITLPKYKVNRISSCHFYPIFVENREDLIIKLKENDIHPGVHYLRNDIYPIYQQANLPNTEYISEHELTLPMHLFLTSDDLNKIIYTVKGNDL